MWRSCAQLEPLHKFLSLGALFGRTNSDDVLIDKQKFQYGRKALEKHRISKTMSSDKGSTRNVK